MKRGWLIYAGLLAVAIAVALFSSSSQQGTGGTSVPSANNNGGAGLAAIRVYLQEQGHTVSANDGPLNELKGDVKVLVVASPLARKITEDELASLKHWISSGGTLFYLAPRAPLAQPAMTDWLQLSEGELLKRDSLEVNGRNIDQGGATAEVWAPRGVLTGIKALRVSADRSIHSDDGAMLPVAGKDNEVSLLWRPRGKGQLLVAAGADLAENRRIELLENRKLWDNLATLGPIAFDEFHHSAAEGPPVSLAILAVIGQALFAVAFLTFARGTRLGPPQPVRSVRHRPGIEYAESFAWLVRKAKVEKELAASVFARLRRIAHERLGIPLSLSDDEFGREVDARLSVEPGRWSALARRFRSAETASKVTDAEFAALSAEAAKFEALLRGA